MQTPPPYAHQEQTIQMLLETPRVFDASDPGTGKTRSVIEFVARLKAQGHPHQCWVFCPKSILQVGWANDIRKFSNLTYAIADAKHRANLTNTTADFILINHDGVKAVKDLTPSPNIAILVIDESTAYKNPSAQRSKAMLKLAENFPRRILMSGTPNPHGVMDLWHQYRILDDGNLLGPSYYRFRNIVCEPTPGPFPRWIDKPGSAEAVADLISPITIRHEFQKVLDIPPNHNYSLYIDLPKNLRNNYRRFEKELLLELEGNKITAKNAAAKLGKLLQIASGRAYTADKEVVNLDSSRTELVADLIEARQQCVVAYNWKHQALALTQELNSRGIKTGLINGETPQRARAHYVNEFQQEKLQVIIAHPATAAHGITLTKGTTTIWTSPTPNVEHYKQFNHRIFRAGQTRKTETINILANDTVDTHVFDNMMGKVNALETLLTILQH